MNNWVTLIKEMVKTLELHPKVQLLTFRLLPPMENERLNFLEKKYSVNLPVDFRSFYKALNGLQLRWIFTENEFFDADKSVFKEEILSWDFCQKEETHEDGAIMILPLELFLKTHVFDACSAHFEMKKNENDFTLFLREKDDIFTSQTSTDFQSYFDFLIAGKGLLSRRPFFYKKEIGHYFETLSSFWTTQKILNLDQALFKNRFLLADQVCFSTSQINSNLLRQMAKYNVPFIQDELEEILQKHHQFLMSGGAGGEWKVLEIKGLVTAFYENEKSTEGEQLILERNNLTEINFKNIELPYSNCCASLAESVDFSQSNFSYSIFTDAFLSNGNFSKSNFSSVDFSRSDLKNANFYKANLKGADFENCDLEGANFQGANLDGASFVGTNLKNLRGY